MTDIESGIDIPDPARSNPNTKYPFKTMDVSESFFVPFTGEEPDALISKRIYAAVSWANSQYEGKRFLTRTVDGGMRVWRTE